MSATTHESIGEKIGELSDSERAFAKALSAVSICAIYTRGWFNPDSAGHSFDGLHRSLGYTSDVPKIALASFVAGLTGSDGNPIPLVYAPCDVGYTLETHVAGITAVIAEAPSPLLDGDQKGELIAKLIAEWGEGVYDQYDSRVSPIALRKRKGIRSARHELIERMKQAELDGDMGDYLQYEIILRSVEKHTLHNLRVAGRVVGGTMLAGFAMKRLANRAG